jgi:hypothetical protein
MSVSNFSLRSFADLILYCFSPIALLSSPSTNFLFHSSTKISSAFSCLTALASDEVRGFVLRLTFARLRFDLCLISVSRFTSAAAEPATRLCAVRLRGTFTWSLCCRSLAFDCVSQTADCALSEKKLSSQAVHSLRPEKTSKKTLYSVRKILQRVKLRVALIGRPIFKFKKSDNVE